MNIPLSLRLRACCDLVPRGSRVADICCDHGYLGIYLLQQGIASSVIASDINEQPLQSALRNAEKFGVKVKMQLYLSDGCKELPRDFDTLVCAGVGADVMVSILEAAPWLKDPRYRLILQCQSKVPTLRRFLSEQGWQIAEETLVRDGGFLYTVMLVRYSPGSPLTPGGWYLSPALLAKSCPELGEYRARVVKNLRLAVEHNRNAAPWMAAALEELQALPQGSQWFQEDNQ